jgi:hypothetical protein
MLSTNPFLPRSQGDCKGEKLKVKYVNAKMAAEMTYFSPDFS